MVCAGRVVSYKALDAWSDALCAELAARHVGPRDIVALPGPCDETWIARFLGILKAGAACAPISPSMPAERVDFIAHDIASGTDADDSMIVYYTSGSTGAPKGVVLSRSGVSALCRAHVSLCALTCGTKAGVQADVGFDSFALSTLPVLYAGGTLYLMNEAERNSLVGVHRFLMKHRIDITFLTTQFATAYMRAFDNPYLKTLLTGGEAIHSHTPRGYAVYNLYGPTECTVYVTAHKLRADDEGDIPIGTPTGENRVMIEDGELCVSGPQLALGYLNQPEETAMRFVPNPHYDPAVDAPHYARMYRTGDCAQLDAHGALRYRGRRDNQVKISGHRIEPGEVESALMKHPDLACVCVRANRTPAGEAFLTAYCAPQKIAPQILKEFLARSLPAYMIPRHFVMMDELALDMRTGKVDLSALPNP